MKNSIIHNSRMDYRRLTQMEDWERYVLADHQQLLIHFVSLLVDSWSFWVVNAHLSMCVSMIVVSTIVLDYFDQMDPIEIEERILRFIVSNPITSSKTSSESVSWLFRLMGIDRYCFEFLDKLCWLSFKSRSDSSSVASRTVVKDRPLSIQMKEKRSNSSFLTKSFRESKRA